MSLFLTPKINKIQQMASEKEKLLREESRADKEQLVSRSKIEMEKLKSKYYDDLQANINDYEIKLTDLRLK
jgi:hypothetical protein